MFQEKFETLKDKETGKLLDDINPLTESGPFNPESTAILAVNTSFYNGYRFFDITDNGVTPPLKLFVVGRSEDKDYRILSWSNEPIYALNKDVPIKLTKKNVSDYVRFFFTYVRGKHGRFIIIDNVDDINWRESPPPAARKAVAKMIKPLSLESGDKKTGFVLKASMMFRDSLFSSDIHVTPNGMIELSNEELLIEDMPVLDDVFGH